MRCRQLCLTALACMAVMLSGCALRHGGVLQQRGAVHHGAALRHPAARRDRTARRHPAAPRRQASRRTALPPPAANPRRPGRVVTPGENMPDPFVLRTRHGYYLYSSQTGLSAPPISVAFSRSFEAWSRPRVAMTSVPRWAVDGFTWSPDVAFEDGRYVLYYDAWAVPAMFYEPWLHDLASHAQCIGTATARGPLGPFRPEDKPLVCMFDHHGAIDPRVFAAPGGQVWLDWKSDDNANFPTPTSVTHLFAQRLDKDGLHLVGRRFQLMAADRPWEHRIVEAPQMVHAGGTYWLFFSGDWFNQPGYSIGVARCAGPAGPCVDRVRPFLASNVEGKGPGEASLFQDGAGRWWMVYSAWFDGFEGREYRPVALARVAFGQSGPYVAKAAVP